MSVSFKPTEIKTTVNPGKIFKKYLQAYKQVVVSCKLLLDLTLTQVPELN